MNNINEKEIKKLWKQTLDETDFDIKELNPDIIQKLTNEFMKKVVEQEKCFTLCDGDEFSIKKTSGYEESKYQKKIAKYKQILEKKCILPWIKNLIKTKKISSFEMLNIIGNLKKSIKKIKEDDKNA